MGASRACPALLPSQSWSADAFRVHRTLAHDRDRARGCNCLESSRRQAGHDEPMACTGVRCGRAKDSVRWTAAVCRVLDNALSGALGPKTRRTPRGDAVGVGSSGRSDLRRVRLVSHSEERLASRLHRPVRAWLPASVGPLALAGASSFRCRGSPGPEEPGLPWTASSGGKRSSSAFHNRSRGWRWDALMSFFSPTAHQAPESRDRQSQGEPHSRWSVKPFLTQPTASTGFFNLSTPYSLPRRPGLFHPGGAHGVMTLQRLSLTDRRTPLGSSCPS